MAYLNSVARRFRAGESWSKMRLEVLAAIFTLAGSTLAAGLLTLHVHDEQSQAVRALFGGLPPLATRPVSYSRFDHENFNVIHQLIIAAQAKPKNVSKWNLYLSKQKIGHMASSEQHLVWHGRSYVETDCESITEAPMLGTSAFTIKASSFSIQGPKGEIVGLVFDTWLVGELHHIEVDVPRQRITETVNKQEKIITPPGGWPTGQIVIDPVKLALKGARSGIVYSFDPITKGFVRTRYKLVGWDIAKTHGSSEREIVLDMEGATGNLRVYIGEGNVVNLIRGAAGITMQSGQTGGTVRSSIKPLSAIAMHSQTDLKGHSYSEVNTLSSLTKSVWGTAARAFK